jgi:hypothetical protein
VTQKHPVPIEVFNTKEGYFVVRLSTLEQADKNKFPAARKNLEKRLAYQKQEEFSELAQLIAG